MKETNYSNDEDKKNLARLVSAADKLNSKMKAYKKSSEEATESANAAMSKFRKLAHELDEANERAEMAEAAERLCSAPPSRGGPDSIPNGAASAGALRPADLRKSSKARVGCDSPQTAAAAGLRARVWPSLRIPACMAWS